MNIGISGTTKRSIFRKRSWCLYGYREQKTQKEQETEESKQFLVREDVHILIHATTEQTITKYLSDLNLNKKQLAKLNKLRKEAGYAPISAWSVSAENGK